MEYSKKWSIKGGALVKGKGWLVDMLTEHTHKVAIAMEDEKRISRHFRAAPSFLVFTVKKGKLFSAEMRENAFYSVPPGHDGKAECLKVMEEILNDVRVVIVSGMGENAYVGLLRRDVLPLLTDEEYADRAIEEYLHGRLKEQPGLVHGKEGER